MDQNSSSSDDESQSQHSEVEETVDEAQDDTPERVAIRNQISTMSFEELQKLKEKIGLKVYNDVIFGKTSARREPKTEFKRANKNRPREMSSKIRVRDAPLKAKHTTVRDPRFDSLCGDFDKKTFKSNYKFLRNIKEKERGELQKTLKKERNPAKKNDIKLLMQRIDNQLREEEHQDKISTKKIEEMKVVKNTLRKGKKPVFMKKSEKRLEDLVTRFDELKKTNKLQKHFKRHTQKLMKKDRKVNDFLN